MALLQVYVYDGEVFFAPETYSEMEGFEKVEGLGDDAFVSGALGLSLQILDGDRTIDVTVSGVADDAPDALRQALLDLGEKVVEAV